MSINNIIGQFSDTSHYSNPSKQTPEWPRKNKYHNSINNPQFPKPLGESDSQTSTFTVIGNMVTKEFLECVELVTMMHKYKSRHFAKPFIEGLTQLEWADALKDLKYEFGHQAFSKGNQQVAVLLQNKIIGNYDDLRAMIEQTYYINRPNFNPFERGVKELKKYVTGTERPFVYLNIAVNGDFIGTLIVELYTDLVPLTCLNFIRLCTKRNGGYSGSPVHRIVKDGWLQCGGYTMKSVKMSCENYIIHHDRRGVLSMANNGRHCDNSTQFFINLQRADWMDSKYVAFGQVISGDNTLKAIEQLTTRYEAPIDKVVIFRTGILNMEQDIPVSKRVKSFTDGHIQNVSVLVSQIIQELWKSVEPQLKEIKSKLPVIKQYWPILPVNQDISKAEKFIYSYQSLPVEQKDEESLISEQVSGPIMSAHISEPINEINEVVSLTNSIKTVSDVEVQKFSQPKLYFHSLVNVMDRAENSLLEIELEPSQTMFTEIKKVENVSKFHLTMIPQEEDFLQMDSEDEREAYAYVREHGDTVSFSGSTIAKIARKIYEPYVLNPTNNKTIRECYCKIRTSSSHQFVRESIIHVDEDEMTETTLARFLRQQTINQSISKTKFQFSKTKNSESARLTFPTQQCFHKNDEKQERPGENERVSPSVLKKRITNFERERKMVLDPTKKRPSITVDAYKLKQVTTTMLPEAGHSSTSSTSSTCTCDVCLSSSSINCKPSESSCGKDDNSSTASFIKIRPGLHLKGDTPTYVSMRVNQWNDNCYIEDSLPSLADEEMSY